MIHPDRLSLLAQRHAPFVRITSVEARGATVDVTLSCGHVEAMNLAVFRVGDERRCRKCGRAHVLAEGLE